MKPPQTSDYWTKFFMKKMLDQLAEPTHFARLAPKLKPLTKRQYKVLQAKKYLNTLWLALKGHDFEEDWDR